MISTHLKRRSSTRWALAWFATMFLCGAHALASTAGNAALEAAEGLWAYESLQAGGKGEALPLSGVLLFKDGIFAQQSVFDGEPFEEQTAMAHAGPYGAGPGGIHMTARQTIAIAPGKTPALRFRRDTEHDISVDRAGDDMTIVFGSGTVQKLKRLGPADGEIHSLENGVLALVDGYFVLVAGTEQAVVTGYGKYERNGANHEWKVIRWSEATDGKAINRRHVSMKVTFDGKLLSLEDGRTFRVVTERR